MRFQSSFVLFAFLCAGSASAVSVTVAPTTGVAGTAVTNTIADAIAQINAGADASNSVILRSTEGPHTQTADSALAINAGKSVDFSAESGQPIIMIQSAGGRYMLTISAGTAANNQTETVTFTDIAFIPQAGLTYANNVADGLGLLAGNFSFNNCVFSSNDGSNGVESQEGDVAYDGTNCVGDDWMQMDSPNNLTISHCTITGANDDAILFGGAAAPEVATCLIDNGTCIANNGGAGIQIFGSNSDLVVDGEASRVLIADNGERANDTGIKFFWDVDTFFTMNKADVITHGNGGIADFEGVERMTITESRIAFNNQDALTGVANLSVWDTSDDSPTMVQEITLDNVTIHNAGSAASILGTEGGNQPRQEYTIVDSIFSGTGDSFAEMTNATNVNGASPAPVHTFSAVVTAGPHAVADVGELAGAAVSADPVYVSETYTIGRDQENPNFLLPTAAEYLTAGSAGSFLRGGAPMPAANSVLVDSGGSGDFTSVQAAISSYTAGGANAGAAEPFVVKIKAGSGPYDEAITLDPSVVGQGDIVGDIVIESDTSGTKVVLKLQKTASVGGADDGLFIFQNEHDVTFRDIIFTRSISTPANMPTDELVRVDESAPNTDMNLISFYNCVFTEPDTNGDPMIVDKAGALLPPGTRGGPDRIAGARLLQFWGDAGESNQLIVDNCAFYFGTSTNVTARNDGAGPEFITINDSISAWAGFDCWNIGGANPAAVLTVTGTDQTAGPLNCTVGYNPLVGGHCFTIAGTATGHTSNVNGIIAYSQGTDSTPAGTNASRGVSGGRSNLTLQNAIINVPSYGVVDVTEAPSIWNNVTILNATGAYLGVETAAGVAAPGSLLITNSIISGPGTKFVGLNATGLPVGGITLTNSAPVTEGPHAIGGPGTVTEVNVINADPQYASLDGTNAAFLDVQSSAYATAGVAGAPLAGGADYIGGSSVDEWSIY